ncbi:hypothetical protein B7Y94_05795 [Candidatus Saccharibacteria bacterium 32-49-12]|nr:MAG: hypothetical protein B7Y94_05795 [Candidatus Saccharibacteria bacterium 32-49-12]
MIEVERCRDKDAWDNFVLENEGHPLQLWGWGQVKSRHGWRSRRYFGIQDGETVVGVQVLVRRLPFPFMSFAYVPRGPIGREADFCEFVKLVSEIVKKDHKSVALSVEPNSRETFCTSDFQPSSVNVLSRETILLDLTRSEGDLLADMSKKTRQYIRKSATDGVTVRRARNHDDVQRCLEIYHQTADRAGFNLHKEEYYLDIFEQMGEHAPIFMAEYEGEAIGFLWMALSADTAYELYGGVTEVGQRMRANYTLKWSTIQKMKEWGITNYDFGGLVAGGVANFKHGWAAEETVFAGTFDKPLSPLYPIWTKALPWFKQVLQKIKRRA